MYRPKTRRIQRLFCHPAAPTPTHRPPSVTDDTSAVRLLHLEDSRVDHALVKFALQRSQFRADLTLVDTLDDFRREVTQGGYAAVLADYHLPGFTGLDAWDVVRETGVVTVSERGATRMDDRASDASIERRKKEGYF